MKKEVWFELTFRVNDMALAASIVDQVSFDCYADGVQDAAHKFSYYDQVGGAWGVDEQAQIWLRFEGKFAFTPQPRSELLLLTGTLARVRAWCWTRLTWTRTAFPNRPRLG